MGTIKGYFETLELAKQELKEYRNEIATRTPQFLTDTDMEFSFLSLDYQRQQLLWRIVEIDMRTNKKHPTF